jgi:hypothetical protein
MGFETEMRGIPEKYKKEVNDLIWKFVWDNKPNQIERNVCYFFIFAHSDIQFLLSSSLLNIV